MRAIASSGLALARIVALMIGSAVELRAVAAAQDVASPERVTFMSADGHTTLVAYVFTRPHMSTLRVPAVVMMHGRGGAYSTRERRLRRRHPVVATYSVAAWSRPIILRGPLIGLCLT